MNRPWVLYNLTEAHEALSKILVEMHKNSEYDYPEFSVDMRHLYHHLNTAWNARDAVPGRVQQVTDSDFNDWSRFPDDLPMMEV